MGSSKRSSLSESSIDRKSFILGMITAFAECLAGEAKKLAFSPPFYPEDYRSLRTEAERICQEQGIFLWHEKNADLPSKKRLHWLVLFKFPEVLEEYKKLRQEGSNPALHLEKLKDSARRMSSAPSRPLATHPEAPRVRIRGRGLVQPSPRQSPQ